MTESAASSLPAVAPAPKRKRSGTAVWHMSRKAVSLSVAQVHKLSDRECLDFFVKARFGGWDSVRCPHCGTQHRHYWRVWELRWKCVCCGKTFSATSGTVFTNHKLTLREILAGALMWINSAAGQPALELKRHVDTTYNTAFLLQHKLREALVRGYNVGLLNGDIEMDGAHQSGRRAAEKRGRPQITQPVDATTPEAELKEAMLTQSAQQTARNRRKKPEGKIDPEFGRRLPKDRRILFSIRKRSGIRGRGAAASRVAIGLVEDSPVAKAVMESFVAVSESLLNTDTSPAYADLGKRFRTHRTVEHSKRMAGPNGENNNQAEELNWRFDRAEKGIYLNIEPKYMLDYAVETSFRSDVRRLPNGKQLQVALGVALGVGESMFWKGFTHGKHRNVELIHPEPQDAKASGPMRGRHPNSQMNGRAPR